VFENRVLRRIFGPKRDEVTGGWRKLHNEELHSLYSSSSIIIMVKSKRRWAGHVSRMGRKGMLIGYWWENQKRPLGRPTRRWVDNIKMDWLDLAQDTGQWRALVNAVMNFRVP
jgi:hypothetical protein